MLCAAVGTVDGDAVRRQALGDRGGDRRAAEARVLHAGQVRGGEVGVVEQARHVVGGAAADAQAVGLHQLEDRRWIPDVGEVDGLAPEHRGEEGAEHAHEVPDRRGREQLTPVGRVPAGQLPDLESQGLVAVDDALRVAGGAGGEGDQRGLCRVSGDDAGHRGGGEEILEVLAYYADDRYVSGQVRLV